MLVDSAQSFLEKRSDPRWVRTTPRWDSVETQKIWAETADLGWLGLLFSEQDGGFGLGLAEAMIIGQAAGRHLFPLPLGETAVLCALLRRGAPKLNLPVEDICTGKAALAWLEIDKRGKAKLLDHAAQCSHVLVTFESPDGGMCATVVPVNALSLSERLALDPACTLAQWEPTPDERARLECTAVTVTPEEARNIEAGWRLYRLADVLGTAYAGFDMTRKYVTERIQFGAPIGSFQAVKHRLADTAMALDVSNLAIWEAAVQIDAGAVGEAAQLAVDFAHLSVEQAAARVRTEIIQFHGAIGYTWEYDAHLYQKRIIRINTGLTPGASVKRIATAAINEIPA